LAKVQKKKIMKQVPNQINIRQIVAVQVIRYIIPLGILAKDTFLHAKHKLKFKITALFNNICPHLKKKILTLKNKICCQAHKLFGGRFLDYPFFVLMQQCICRMVVGNIFS
jgi:hypothetical protein